MKRFLKNNAMMLLFFASSAVVLLIAIYANHMMRESAKMIEASTMRQMSALSEAAALLVTADELDGFMTLEDMQKPEYGDLKLRLDTFTRQADIMFTYYMRLDTSTDMMQFIVDNVLDPADEPDGLDSPQVAREDAPDLALAGTVNTVPLGSYSQGWDGLLSAWAPVFYSDGTPSNIVAGVDMQDVYIKEVRHNITLLAWVLTIAMVVVLGTCFLCMSMYRKKARQSNIANEAKSSFLSRMSHEMRTPMNAIIGLTNMALEAENPQSVHEHLGNIGVSAQHLRYLIDDVLDISKIESGKMQLELVPCRLQDIIAGIETIIRPQAEAKKLNFTIAIGKSVPSALRCDSTHLRQVVINLLSNAVKFTPENGEVSLSVALLERRGDRCNLQWRVRDTGIGIDSSAREAIFVPFEQGDISTTRKFGGTGLGLAIAKQLVGLMGGTILVESEPGHGSEFIFNTWFDVVDVVQAAPADSPHSAQEKPDLTGKRILLVEDAEINQMIAVDMLSRYGAQIDVAGNGQIGLDMYLRAPEQYDLIFMDIQMPVMDGYEATRRIRASGAKTAHSVPIIAVTANAFQEDIDRALAAGMNGHVRKPLDISQVEGAIHDALRRSA